MVDPSQEFLESVHELLDLPQEVMNSLHNIKNFYQGLTNFFQELIDFSQTNSFQELMDIPQANSFQELMDFFQETICDKTCNEMCNKMHDEIYDEVHDETYDEVHEEMHKTHKGQNLVGINGPLPHINKAIVFTINDTFSNWSIAEHYVAEYGHQKGFVAIKICNKTNHNGCLINLYYKCEFSRTY
ncbi:10244_t:CDS:1 [Gigaspora margarita]|uniref:10244_t:CDS:1 n=1 Tax=Gigaspora margarita TaxID=4874 RepID=A0ABN7V3V8_GIGMA|nr:10244_t:CDS:1 [Gigaspora margarita]